jgi:hypothetical protein
MTSFDHREEAFEAKFAHDEERTFKARAGTLRMLGLWAAEKRGETGGAADESARTLIETEVVTPDAAFDKPVLDLADDGIDSRQTRKNRDALLAIAQSASA